MKPNCGNCKLFEFIRDDKGWCHLKKVDSKRRSTRTTNWCQRHEEREILEPEDSPQSAGHDDNREQRELGNTRSESTHERRVEMGRAKVVLFWNDDTQEIAVSVYREGEADTAVVLMADLSGGRSTRPVPELHGRERVEYDQEDIFHWDSSDSPI